LFDFESVERHVPLLATTSSSTAATTTTTDIVVVATSPSPSTTTTTTTSATISQLSALLHGAATQCDGNSARSLRKLPFLTIALVFEVGPGGGG
jgi:hypothetical protein